METSKNDQTIRVLNLRLLLATLAVALVAAPGLYAWHLYQVDRIAKVQWEHVEYLHRQQSWGQAIAALQRYLSLRPTDAEARVRLAQTFDQLDLDEQGKQKAIDLYYRAVGLAPGQTELRVRLAKLLLEDKRFAAAREQAEQLIKLEPGSVEGRRILAVSVCELFLADGLAPIDDAVAAVSDALLDRPGDPQLAQMYALLLRNHVQEPEEAIRQQLANDALDRMVETAPDLVDAYMTRYRYRVQYGLDGADSDLKKALDLAPENVEVLLTAADDAQRREATSVVRDLYRQIVNVAPRDLRGWLGLGDSYLAAEDYEMAIDTWRKGLDTVDPENLDLNLRLAKLLIQRQRLDEAQVALTSLEEVQRMVAQRRTQGDLAQLRPTIQLLWAKWHLARGERQVAVPLLRSVTFPSHEQGELRRDVDQQVEAARLLAKTYEQLGQWNFAAKAHELSVQLQPTQLSWRVDAVRSWSAAGQLDEAIRQCAQLAKFVTAPPETWMLLARLQIAGQLRFDASHRDSEPVEYSLYRARKVLPDSWELKLLSARAIALRGNEISLHQAIGMLRQVAEEPGHGPSMWLELAQTYEELRDLDAAEEALSKCVLLDRQTTATRLLKAKLLAQWGDRAAAQEQLLAAFDEANGDEGMQVLQALADLARLFGKDDEARQYLLQLAGSEPWNIEPVRQLAELAVETGLWEEVKRWEEKLRAQEGPDGGNWRYYRARRLLALAENPQSPQFAQAIQLQAELERVRPGWFGGEILKGIIAERQHREPNAISAYRTAIHLGAERAFLHEWIVRLLYSSQRFTEAAQYLAGLQAGAYFGPHPFAAAPVISYAQGEWDRAAELTQQRLARSTPQPLQLIWQAEALLLAGRSEDAKTSLRQAVDLAPHSVEPWAGLLSFQIRNGQRDDALRTLSQLAEQVRLSPAAKPFVLAQGYELVDDLKQAEAFYRQAQQLSPESIDVKLRLAVLLTQSNAEEAENLLRQVLELSPQHEEARRQLGIVLAIRRQGGAAKSHADSESPADNSGASTTGIPVRHAARSLASWRRPSLA